MNTNYSKEELLQNLPDYYSGSISDKDLNAAIQNKLETDIEFKKEAYEQEKVFLFLESAEWNQPSDNYFANLSVRINEKISDEYIPLSLTEKLKAYLRFAFPVIAAMILFVSAYFYFFSSDEINVNNFTKNDPVKITEKDIKNLTTESPQVTPNGINIPPVSIEKNGNNDITDHSKNSDRSNYILNKDNKNIYLNDTEYSEYTEEMDNSDYSENSDNEVVDDSNNSDNMAEIENGLLISDDSEDEFLEEDLFDLTPEEQQELVDYLKKS